MTPSKAVLLFLSAVVPALAGAAPNSDFWPTQGWKTATPSEMGMEAAGLRRARDHALRGGGSGYITRGGRLVISWGDPARRYDLKSTTKSIGVTALGLAIGDGKIKLDDRANQHHPSFGTPPAGNTDTGWLGDITIRQLATQTAGFDKPGGYTSLLFKPGTKWSYSDGGPNWLAECITLAYRKDLEKLMFERVFGPLGITSADLSWRKNAYRPHQIDAIERREFGSGISANVDALARIGYLYLRGGRWEDRQIIPREFVDAARTVDPAAKSVPVLREAEYPGASGHYGLLWWNNADAALARVPRDAFWSWGLHESLIVVIPSLDIVAARAGAGWRDDRGAGYEVLRPFLEAIAGSARTALPVANAPCAPSAAILGVAWSPLATITRLAPGSDNWPITWADDDSLYTAYGDGWGFAPRVPEKLSLGLAKIDGPPDRLRGINLRSPSAEQTGDGRAGRKASGMLMVDGVLYMWVRNADNAQLAWSSDHGRSWTWSTWRLEISFGCPTFLNFGRNYRGARDEYVYVYSHDHDSAYEAADRMILARVPRNRIRDRAAYEFFTGLDDQPGALLDQAPASAAAAAASTASPDIQTGGRLGRPVWTRDIAERGAVFVHAGRCYRSGVSYNAGLQRYLWCQTLHGSDSRFSGGLGIYDAPEPWGPWTTVYFAEQWDAAPGETSCFPTKWMSPDGRRAHLLFSGEDAFSVRAAEFIVP